MIELFGLQLGTLFQGGTMAALVVLLGIVLRAWVVGMPARKKVDSDAQITSGAQLAERYKEWRKEIHDIKNDLAVSAAELTKCNKLALAANATNEQLMFLMELMISEMEMHDASSKIVQRARLMFNRINKDLKDPNKSDALNTAEIAVEDAKQTLVSTKETCAEVKRGEE